MNRHRPTAVWTSLRLRVTRADAARQADTSQQAHAAAGRGGRPHAGSWPPSREAHPAEPPSGTDARRRNPEAPRVLQRYQLRAGGAGVEPEDRHLHALLEDLQPGRQLRRRQRHPGPGHDRPWRPGVDQGQAVDHAVTRDRAALSSLLMGFRRRGPNAGLSLAVGGPQGDDGRPVPQPCAVLRPCHPPVLSTHLRCARGPALWRMGCVRSRHSYVDGYSVDYYGSSYATGRRLEGITAIAGSLPATPCRSRLRSGGQESQAETHHNHDDPKGPSQWTARITLGGPAETDQR